MNKIEKKEKEKNGRHRDNRKLEAMERRRLFMTNA